MSQFALQSTAIADGFTQSAAFQHFSAQSFPTIHPVHWLTSHFAVGGWSPLQRLSGMVTAHMTRIAPHNGFTWHPHRALEIYTWVLEGELYHEDTTGGSGVIGPGELQRMFAGDYIEHQELNISDHPTRVIQIWYIADRHHRGMEPHYQQVRKNALPVRKIDDADVYTLIGQDSPMEQHMQGRLEAVSLAPGGESSITPPGPEEDLFFYVTDGAGLVESPTGQSQLGQYDVILMRPDAPAAPIATNETSLQGLAFYLPKFLN